jgi:hypothetical protein
MTRIHSTWALGVADRGVGIVERSIVVNTMIQNQDNYLQLQRINTIRAVVDQKKDSRKTSIVPVVTLDIVQEGGKFGFSKQA